ncbi:hypothetical protein H1P_6650002 [Hyella patelloides LEGE 07179]|uniref:Uncharacterized protein n=1 Tax=Hyella patelloides LEGE 07179 TaxID=945734 RepID=A0A563W2U1_9CYAN|nr:hypothetical protein H1P_6650002 [Hyella patelloides LEGE 07179]
MDKASGLWLFQAAWVWSISCLNSSFSVWVFDIGSAKVSLIKNELNPRKIENKAIANDILKALANDMIILLKSCCKDVTVFDFFYFDKRFD